VRLMPSGANGSSSTALHTQRNGCCALRYYDDRRPGKHEAWHPLRHHIEQRAAIDVVIARRMAPRRARECRRTSPPDFSESWLGRGKNVPFADSTNVGVVASSRKRGVSFSGYSRCSQPKWRF
jgi:hypothetical protein